MIDHVSISVRDIAAGARFYEALLATLGMSQLREWPGAAIGYRQEISGVLDQPPRRYGAGRRR